MANGNAGYGPEEETLRLPKTTSKAAMTNRPQGQPVQQPISSVFAYSIGRGTGRGVAANKNSNAVVNGQAPGANGMFLHYSSDLMLFVFWQHSTI